MAVAFRLGHVLGTGSHCRVYELVKDTTPAQGDTKRGRRLTDACLKVSHQHELLKHEKDILCYLRSMVDPLLRLMLPTVLSPEVYRVVSSDEIAATGQATLLLKKGPAKSLGDACSDLQLTREAVDWVFCRLLALFEGVHAARVSHGDVKPDNILFNPESWWLMLIDFGYSKCRLFPPDKPKRVRISRGTALFMPPEVIFARCGDPYAVDVFSLAMTMIAFVTGSVPDGDIEDWAALCERRVDGGGYSTATLCSSPAASYALIDCITVMLDRNPAARPTMKELHTEFRKYISATYPKTAHFF